MKTKSRNITFVFYLTAVVSMFYMLVSGTAVAGTIQGSVHDFSGETFTVDEQICVVCHTPHNADVSVTDAPLWNHTLTTKNFTVYSSPSLDASVAQPNGVSKLCLSCHDGTVALDSFGGKTGTIFMTDLPTDPTKAIGADELNNDHPISFVFDTALATADGGLFDPSTKVVTIGEAGKTKTGTIASVMLSGGKVQCSSCHDVHNNFTIAGTPLLRRPLIGSTICLTCHDK